MTRSSEYSKSAVHYIDDHGKSSEQCSKCSHFIPPDDCAIVAGKVRPGGWCDQFERKKP